MNTEWLARAGKLLVKLVFVELLNAMILDRDAREEYRAEVYGPLRVELRELERGVRGAT